MKKKTELLPRKKPLQARARQMNEDILAGAVRVLVRHGPLKFTTVRVAEEAGVSVGSLYQYYPNKQALLFALHEREVECAFRVIVRILGDERLSPRTRVARVVRYFFRAEADESPPIRRLLDDVAAYYRDSPQHRALHAAAAQRIAAFLSASLPRAQRRRVPFLTEVFFTVVESVGKNVSARQPSRAEVDRWARTCTDLVCGYLGLTNDSSAPLARPSRRSGSTTG